MKIADTHSLFGPIWQIFLPVYHWPQKGHHVLFQFWRIWLLQRSIEQLLSVKCLVLFLVSTQAGNSSVESTFLKIAGKIYLVRACYFGKLLIFSLLFVKIRRRKIDHFRKYKKLKQQEKNNRLQFSVTDIDNQGLWH